MEILLVSAKSLKKMKTSSVVAASAALWQLNQKLIQIKFMTCSGTKKNKCSKSKLKQFYCRINKYGGCTSVFPPLKSSFLGICKNKKIFRWWQLRIFTTKKQIWGHFTDLYFDRIMFWIMFCDHENCRISLTKVNNCPFMQRFDPK